MAATINKPIVRETINPSLVEDLKGAVDLKRLLFKKNHIFHF